MQKRRYWSRSLEDRWVAASGQFPVLLLTGPRQVGKTTLLEHLCEKGRRYVTLDDMEARALAREDPELFLQRFAPPLLVDEIQHAPELLTAIKVAVDRDRQPGMFWLTGSQQFRLMRGVTETLAGRIAIINLLGFSRREKERRQHLLDPFLPTPELVDERARTAASAGLVATYRAIWDGAFPALGTGEITDRDLFYRSYVQTYLERDVRELLNVGDLESFRRFLKASAARTAQILNYSDLARDAGVSVNTARQWLSVLLASFQVFLLEPYHSNITKRLYKRPKLYFLDTGLCAYLTGWSSPETLEAGAMSGAILETYVVSEILKSWWHRTREPDAYYYRDKDDREIDLLLKKDGALYPVEVKKTTRAYREPARLFGPLKRLGEKVGPGAVLCLYPKVLPVGRGDLSVPIGLI